MQPLLNYLISYSPLHAMDAARLKREQEQYEPLSSTKKAILGASVALERLPVMLCYSAILLCARRVIWKKNPASLDPRRLTWDQIVLRIGTAIPEELLCRGCLQAGLECYYRPERASLIILSTHALFALAHIPFSSAARAFVIGLSPMESILFHTTGGLIAPLSAHLTNNTAAAALRILAMFSKRPALNLGLFVACSYMIGKAGLRYINRQTSPSSSS